MYTNMGLTRFVKQDYSIGGPRMMRGKIARIDDSTGTVFIQVIGDHMGRYATAGYFSGAEWGRYVTFEGVDGDDGEMYALNCRLEEGS